MLPVDTAAQISALPENDLLSLIRSLTWELFLRPRLASLSTKQLFKIKNGICSESLLLLIDSLTSVNNNTVDNEISLFIRYF